MIFGCVASRGLWYMRIYLGVVSIYRHNLPSTNVQCIYALIFLGLFYNIGLLTVFASTSAYISSMR